MIGGLVSFPVIILLSMTGIVYLFKDAYEKPREAGIRQVEVGSSKLSYQAQWENAQKEWDKPINSMVLSQNDDQATEFVSGRFGGKKSLFINPYTGEETGRIDPKKTDMYVVRKLHGELLGGSLGTKIVELVGSWFVVLILGGLFLFFPRRKADWVKLFRIRFRGPKDILYRDFHAVSGFWFSIVLLIVMAGGMPWTDVWGNGFKWVQHKTGTGFPTDWQARNIRSVETGEPVTLDKVVDYAASLNLPGEVTISLPASDKGVFSIHNMYHQNQSKQVAIHLDQYSGETLATLNWSDVGFLMRGRMWAMAFHQGHFGLWNWILMLFTATGLLVLSLSAFVAYFSRKKREPFTLPQYGGYKVGLVFNIFIGIMAVFLPLFGLSVILIFAATRLSSLRKKYVVSIKY